MYVDNKIYLLYGDGMQNKIHKRIKDISEVIFGYTFRSTLKEQADGDVLVLQARNIIEDIIIKNSDLIKVDLGNNRTNALAKNNDVVLSSRGSFKSAVIQIDSGTVVAASSVYLLRLKTDKVLPEYLAIYLNSNFAQRQINEKITGVVINAMLKKDVEELEIIIPSLETQKKAVTIYFNNLRHQKLLRQKQLLTNQINQELINQLIKY
ncbi:MAG: restriction endonuclease subunit S [bacterium]|nr:restriction endonuclease subunit S [bacterium]